ncbi:MAG TPA: amino acid transporter [Actinomycetota bacterium]|nr:amino acid transporter [Actinomycetota bacterium]
MGLGLDYGYLWAWQPFDRATLTGIMRGFDRPWWVAGGWALELFVERQIRTHEDVDVAILRRDHLALNHHLGNWDLHYATPDHQLVPWKPAVDLRPPVHGIWARPEPVGPWFCEFLLNESAGDDWVYRRDPSVRMPIKAIGWTTQDGLPILAPTVALLYKAKGTSPKDTTDFDAVAPLLDAEARVWLSSALAAAHPGHEWLDRL